MLALDLLSLNIVFKENQWKVNSINVKIEDLQAKEKCFGLRAAEPSWAAAADQG